MACRLLVHLGADARAKDTTGQRPRDYSKAHGYTKLSGCLGEGRSGCGPKEERSKKDHGHGETEAREPSGRRRVLRWRLDAVLLDDRLDEISQEPI